MDQPGGKNISVLPQACVLFRKTCHLKALDGHLCWFDPGILTIAEIVLQRTETGFGYGGITPQQTREVTPQTRKLRHSTFPYFALKDVFSLRCAVTPEPVEMPLVVSRALSTSMKRFQPLPHADIAHYIHIHMYRRYVIGKWCLIFGIFSPLVIWMGCSTHSNRDICQSRWEYNKWYVIGWWLTLV